MLQAESGQVLKMLDSLKQKLDMGEKRGMKALELWCKRVTDGYQGVKVENMTTSWRDGLAFCALIHHFRPDLIDFSSLIKHNIYENNELAFRTAERHLGIPALLDAEDMVEYEVPDRLSILTYLSQFYQTFASHPSSPIKRSPDSPDHSLVLSTPVSSPPTKEARRREPCFACGLPVFLAQRLLVGGHLYHRTCFRCARCATQLTLANCYETQDGAYCCETCPDEEMGPQELGDKGGGLDEPPPPAHARLMADHKTDPLVTSRAASLVGLRRMMFENIAHTDDEKLPKGRRPSECNGSNERPNKNSFSNKESVELSRNNSDRSSVVPSVKSQSSVIKSDSDAVTLSSSDNCRPKLVVSQYSLEDTSVTTEIGDQDEFSSLHVTTDSNIVETENSDVTSAHSKLDVDSDLEPNSCSSDLSVVQAKNDVINNSDDEIEYNKLIESRESIENKLVEAKNDVVVKLLDKEDNKSLSSEKEALLSHAESGSLKEPEEQVTKTEELVKNITEEVTKTEEEVTKSEEEVTKSEEEVTKTEEEVAKTAEQVKNIASALPVTSSEVTKIAEDEFTSLTHNIEQLVIDAKNEEVVQASNENENLSQEAISNKENVIVSEPRVPTPSSRVVKHKPPTPQKRDVRKISIEVKEKKPQEEYPEDLNPFGDEDEEEKVKPSSSSNPFGSSDEEEESSKIGSEDVPTPTARKVLPAPKITLNPFWSGDEEEDEEESSTPVPKPRKLHTPQPSPQPSPQPRRLRSATGSMGSATSIASRKKKPAPLPPNWQSTIGRKSSAPRPPPVPRTVTPSPPPLPGCSPPGSPPPLDKETKQFFNRQRQNSIVSESSSIGTISSYTPHKSMYGQWKRKKGPAPAIPVPVRRAVPPMPQASVRQELQDIEIKQQGLERQGVKLEQTIRDKFEQEGASLTPYVEEMVLQLFELVNEKNEMFRRQAELMYLRRQHNLEEEHAELEYQIRCLMLCPDHNKTDSDKAREEQLIQRLVEVVERRNEVIDCLEMDRLREKEEDSSVGAQLGIFSAAVGSEVDLRVKSDKKGKKTKKEKRWSRRDGDKDMEEVVEKKKNKKKWFTLPHKS